MSTIHAEASAVIDAAPETIYALLADYRKGHPSILPKQYFPRMIVESGGHGEGTIIRVRTRALGVEREYHLVVSEPAPGRRLIETDEQAQLVTTFTVEPLAGGQRSRVTIATDAKAAVGVAGMMEKLLNPPIMRRIYRTELAQLAWVLAN